MNDYEISKLKKELQRKQELLKEEREDREYTQKQLVQVQAERDKYHGELIIARQSIQNVDGIIGKNIKQMKTKLDQQNSLALNQLRELKDKLIQQKLLNQKLMEQNRNKDTVISELSLRLKQVSRKYKDPSLLVNTKQISEQAMITHNQFYKLTQKYNKLSTDMENILTENKILRKLHGVPDNFGFDLEEIKIAEKQELEDYKSQCRKLQNQIQELEAERTQLRYRLRQYNTLYSNKGERYKDLSQQQFQLLDAYALNLKQGKIQLPQIDKTQKQMQKEILKLRGQVQVLQNRTPMTSMIPIKGGNSTNDQKMNNQQIKRMQEQLKQVLQPFVQDIRKLSQNNLNSIIKNVQNVQNVQNVYNQVGGGIIGSSQYKGPMPLPIAHNDWSKIKEGYSYLYSSKIPVNLKDYEDEVGFNSIKAQYELAALQLQNIESLKLLKEKQKIQNQLCKQVTELKQKYKKCLKVQDQLFMRYFKEKQSVNDKIKKLQIQKNQLKDERDRLELNLNSVTDAFNTLKNKTDIEKKLSEYTSRLAISQSELLKLQRKYAVLNDQHKLLRDNYTNLQTRTLQSQYQLKEKLLKAKNNEKQLTVLTNQILQDVKDSVSGDVHNTLVSRIQAMNDKSANLISKQTELRIKIDKLQSIQRQFNIKDEVIQNLRQDSLDSLLELQIIRNKLEALSPQYKTYVQTFKRLVSFVNDNNISLMSYFKKFDRDGGGNLDKTEFMSSLAALGFKVTNQQMDMMFSEFDLDGSGSITYKQFMRKMRRGGVFARSKEEEAINRLFKAIKHAKLTIRKAFQIIDMDGSNSISKSQMESALRKIGIQTNSQTIGYLFQLCDKDGDGTISCNELERLYHQMISQSSVLEKEVYSEQLDWKLNFILKIQQCSLKYHSSLMETFKSLDADDSGSININEMIQFLKKSGLDIQRKYLIQLFDFIDRKKDGNIQFAQFLKYLQEAKQEQKRIQRIKYIKKRTQQLRRQNQVQSNYANEKSKIGQQASMKIRMMALQTKQNSLLKKNQKLIKDLATKQQQILQLRKNLEEEEKSKFKIQDQYYKEKELAIVLQEKSKNSLTQLQANKLKNQFNKLKIQALESQTSLNLYKGLYEGLTDKNKGEQLRVGKIEAERNKYYDLVKDFQGVTDLNAEIGKLAIQIEYSKRNQQIVNKKYDQIIQDIRKISAQNIKLEDSSLQKQKQIINAHVFFQQKSNNLQRQIDSLNMKIIPTVTLSKLEDHMIKLRQISNSKSSLEQQNKMLREKNFNLQLRNDYVQNQKVHLEQLQRKLRRQYTDESSVTIIDLTKKLSEYKMSELKFKRQANLLKQKEEYYMRINNAHTDNIKDLQEQLGNWEIKYNQREEFWRKRMSDQISLMEDLQKQASKAKEQQLQAANFFKQKNIQTTKIAQKYSQLSGQRQQNISQFIRPSNQSIAENNEYTQRLLQKINSLEQELLQKQKQMHHFKATLKDIVPEANILKLSDFGSQMNVSTNSFVLQTDLTTSQLKNNARRFLNNQKEAQNFYKEQNNRITLAAQQSIETLQRMIDDKNQQIKRKQKTIEELKRQLIRTNSQNCQQIQRLNQQIRDLRMKKQAQGLNQIMSRSTNKNFYPTSKAQTKVQDLMKVIDNKDQQIKNLQNKYDKLFITKNAPQNQKTGAKVQRKLQDLLQEREFQKKKVAQNEQKLQEKIKNLQKLSKDKDLKLGRLQKALHDIKNQVVNEKKVLNQLQVQQNLQQFVKGITKGTNSNDSKMEVMLQQAIQKIHVLTKQNKDLQGEIDRAKEDTNKKFNQTLSKKMKP